MSISNLLLVVAILLVIAIIGATFFIAMSSSMAVGIRLRRLLGARLEVLPFQRMLKKRNVDIGKYLHEAPIADIEQALQNCERCQNLRKCDETLTQDSSGQQDYSFCPNTPLIEGFEQKQSQEITAQQPASCPETGHKLGFNQ